jgi:hypothetical protein
MNDMNKKLYVEFNNIESDLLTCPCCKARYQEPIMLPCQDSVCLKCLKDLKTEAFEQGIYVQCPDCLEKHVKQDDQDYKPSKFILRALQLQPVQVTRGSQFEQNLQSANSLCDLAGRKDSCFRRSTPQY